MSGQAGNDIENCVEKIRRSCPKTASFKTKENALETLRKSGKSICLSVGVVGREVRKSCGYQTTLISTMLGIAVSLADEEIERLRPWCNDKLVELQGIANDCCVFEDLGEVIHLWGEDRLAEHEGSSDTNENAESPSEDASDEEERDISRLVAVTGTAAKPSRTALHVP